VTSDILRNELIKKYSHLFRSKMCKKVANIDIAMHQKHMRIKIKQNLTNISIAPSHNQSLQLC